MRQSISSISRTYAKGFMEFLIENEIAEYKATAYELFVYSIYSIYGVKYTKNLNSLIVKNGNKCIAYLKKLEGVPKRLKILSVKDKQFILDCSCVYVAVAIQFYTGGIKIVKS